MKAKEQLITTRYKKSIKDPKTAKTVLKPGSNNAKLGFVVTSKKWKGKRLYSLTLTERATCDISCHHWDDCYGNNMPFAHRFSTEGLIPRLREEIAILLAKHKHGIVVRLHVLGDFYSVEYVKFWHEMLETYPKLCIFGYTGVPRYGQLSSYIRKINASIPDRCVIRLSRGSNWDDVWSYASEESFEGDSFVCPEQTGKVKSCAACGLCWTTTKTVRFLTH
jgi:hypothetical protein